MGTLMGCLYGLLSLLTIVFLVRRFPPLMESIRILEQQKKPRGERGRALLRRMAPMGLSLRGKDLRDADLRNAFLADVDLSGTDLRGVDLTGANLGGAWLAGARYDEHTRWPEGFDPQPHGAVKVE